ncbi:MAG TPA: VOC family protein [Anaerolineae bacterium]|nr:VOC family protein [Anaerolineae bacterium]
MTHFDSYSPGTFCWTDLTTPDPAGAKAFYTQLFGWEAVDLPVGPDMVYTTMNLEGKNVAALFQMDPEQQAQGVPPHWISYVSVANAAESAARAKALGGTVMVDAFDVMEEGRMAVIQDPTGGILSLWEPKRHIGARIVNEPGTLSWNELATRDTEKAKAFYTQLFGWNTQVQEMPTMTYTTFLNNGRMNAGMLAMTEEWGDMPPHWMVYFAVADCDASAEKVTALGGQVHVPPTDIPVGRFAVVGDPQGAVFTIMKINDPD